MEEYKKILEEMTNVFHELTSIASVKLEAASKNRVTTVEECMKKEQPIVMKLRGIEQKREKLQAQLGYDGLAFREIIDTVGDGEKEELLPVYDGLSRAIQMFQKINDDVEQAIRLNLRDIDRALNKQSESVYTDGMKAYGRTNNKTDRSV